ncbi:MAG: aldo/keto reductase [Bacteroidota bacterium]
MRLRPLGTTDLQVSEISLGCMSLGLDHQENARIIHAACDRGVNLFDTADLYDKGFNEISLGKALKDRRDKVFIATKVGNEWQEDGMGWQWNPHKSYIQKAVYESLRRLDTDYIDLYQLHGGTIEDPLDETISAFEELKQAGLIRHYGISSIRPNVVRSWVPHTNLASVMTQYSLIDKRPEEFTLNYLSQHGVGVIVRGAIAKGYLVGKPSMDLLGHSSSDIQYFTQRLIELSQDTPYSPLHLAIAFTLGHPSTATVTVGASRASHIIQSAELMQLPPIPAELYDALNALTPAFAYDSHR